MSVTELILTIAVIAALVITARSIHFVGSGEVHHLLRFGLFKRTLGSGFHLVLPFGAEFHPVSIRKQRIALRVPAFTSEGLNVALDLQVIFTVFDPGRFAAQRHAVAGFPHSVMGFVRNEVAGFTLIHLRKALDVAQTQCRFAITECAHALGMTINELVVFGLHVPREVELHGAAETIGDSPRTMELIRLDATREVGRRTTPILDVGSIDQTQQKAA